MAAVRTLSDALGGTYRGRIWQWSREHHFLSSDPFRPQMSCQSPVSLNSSRSVLKPKKSLDWCYETLTCSSGDWDFASPQINGVDIRNREEAVAILTTEDSVNFSLLLARPDVEVNHVTPMQFRAPGGFSWQEEERLSVPSHPPMLDYTSVFTTTEQQQSFFI